MANPIAGWYPDPSGDQTKLRWWDGNQWTDNYADAVAPQQQPVQPQTAAQSQATAQPQQPAQPQAARNHSKQIRDFLNPNLSSNHNRSHSPNLRDMVRHKAMDRLLNSQGRVTLRLRVRPLMTPYVSSPLFLLLFLRFQYAGQLFRLLGYSYDSSLLGYLQED